MNSAIILAGGTGQRFDSDVPKQFLKFNFSKKRMLRFSFDKFTYSDMIDEIIIVVCKGWKNTIEKEYKNCKIVNGGETRSESSMIGLKACSKKCKKVLIHDAARPLFPMRMIKTGLECLERGYYAAIPVIKSKDSLINLEKMQYYNREKLRYVQTPQAFDYEKISKAYFNASLLSFPDDMSVIVEHYPDKCITFEGEENNIKVTNKIDFELAQILLNNEK